MASFSGVAQSEFLTTDSYVKQIETLAASSSCASYAWKERGVAPVSYVKGVALAFGRSVCRMSSTAAGPAKIMSEADTGAPDIDAISYYRKTFNKLKMPVNVAGVETMRAEYTLLMGLGMRESSGKYCEGWDTTAGTHRPSETGEAGAFQVSYDSIIYSPELTNLYKEYKAAPQRCMLAVWQDGVTCDPQDVLGTGDGADYQKFNKICPAFTAEYATTLLRLQRGHWGPIVRKEAEVKTTCYALLGQVEKLVQGDMKNACAELF